MDAPVGVGLDPGLLSSLASRPVLLPQRGPANVDRFHQERSCDHGGLGFGHSVASIRTGKDVPDLAESLSREKQRSSEKVRKRKKRKREKEKKRKREKEKKKKKRKRERERERERKREREKERKREGEKERKRERERETQIDARRQVCASRLFFSSQPSRACISGVPCMQRSWIASVAVAKTPWGGLVVIPKDTSMSCSSDSGTTAIVLDGK